jgi:hypothetical protein
MIEDKLSFQDPRVLGIHEHYERLQMFYDLAIKEPVDIKSFRFLMAAIYSAQSIIEIITESSRKGLLPVTPEQLEREQFGDFPRYSLVEKIRIHDFHRFGLVPPDRCFKTLSVGGPIKLMAHKGTAIYSITQKICTGDSNINEQRPLLIGNGKFFDEKTGEYVTLKQILKDFLEKIPAVIGWFEKSLKI